MDYSAANVGRALTPPPPYMWKMVIGLLIYREYEGTSCRFVCRDILCLKRSFVNYSIQVEKKKKDIKEVQIICRVDPNWSDNGE